jgi:hypothetical protein
MESFANFSAYFLGIYKSLSIKGVTDGHLGPE